MALLPHIAFALRYLDDSLRTIQQDSQADRLRLLEEGNYAEAAEALEVYLDAQRALEQLQPIVKLTAPEGGGAKEEE